MTVLLVYALVGAFLLVLAVAVYLFAVSSRRSYKCSQCGERLTTEYLAAQHCGHCGARLEREA